MNYCMKKEMFGKNAVQASVTVEAAFVVPIILFVFVGVVLLVFYLFNVMKMENDADKALFNLERMGKKHGTLVENVVMNIGPALEGYLNVESVSGTAKMLGDELKVEIVVDHRIPDIPFLPTDTLAISRISRQLKLYNSSERGRQIKAVFETVDLFKNVFEAMKKRR